MAKPYYYHRYSDLYEGPAPTALLYFELRRRLQHLIKVDLMDSKQVGKVSPLLNNLVRTIGIVSNLGKLREFSEGVEVSLDIADKAFKERPRLVSDVFDVVVRRLNEFEEEVHYSAEAYQAAKEESDCPPIKRFKTMFDYYKDLYEDNYSIVSTFPFLCFELITGSYNSSASPSDYLLIETKDKVEKLSSPLILKRFPISVLTRGCDRHIRNALSHGHRHIFTEDGSKARLIDKNSKGVTTYDYTFSLSDFEAVLADLRATISSMRSALVVFNINEAQFISRHVKPAFTRKEIEGISYLAAKDSFLDLESLKFIGDDVVELVVQQQARRRGEYFVGVGHLVEKVELPKIPPASEQLARFLQLTYLDTGRIFKRMKVTLLDLNGEEVGYVETDTGNFSHKCVKDFLDNVIANTIPDDFLLEVD